MLDSWEQRGSVEVATDADTVAVRLVHDTDCELMMSREEWTKFLSDIKDGRFDNI